MPLLIDHLSASIIGGIVFLLMITLFVRQAETKLDASANDVAKAQSADAAEWMEDDLLIMGEHINEGTGGADYEVPFWNCENFNNFCKNNFGNEDVDLDGDGNADERVTRLFAFARDAYEAEEDYDGMGDGEDLNEDGDTADTIRVNVAYTLHDAGTVQLGSRDVPAFRMERIVCSGPGGDAGPAVTNWCFGSANRWTRQGGTTGLLGHFQVDLLDRTGRIVPNARATMDNDPDHDAVRNVRISFDVLSPFGDRLERERRAVKRHYYGSTLMIRVD